MIVSKCSKCEIDRTKKNWYGVNIWQEHKGAHYTLHTSEKDSFVWSDVLSDLSKNKTSLIPVPHDTDL